MEHKEKEVVIDIENGDASVSKDPSSNTKWGKKSLNKLVGGILSLNESVGDESVAKREEEEGEAPTETTRLLGDKVSEGEESEGLRPVVGKENERERRKSGKVSKKAAKPPRPPKGPTLDAADMRLLKEISRIAIKKRERMERLKALKRMRSNRLPSALSSASSSSSSMCSSAATISAMFVTAFFFLVLILQGIHHHQVHPLLSCCVLRTSLLIKSNRALFSFVELRSENTVC